MMKAGSGKSLNKEEVEMKAEVKGNKLIVEVDLREPAPSKSGKTLIVATSSGIQTTDAEVKGKKVKIGLNAFIAKD